MCQRTLLLCYAAPRELAYVCWLKFSTTSGNLLRTAICYERKENALFTALARNSGFSLHKGIINTAQQHCSSRSQLEWVVKRKKATKWCVLLMCMCPDPRVCGWWALGSQQRLNTDFEIRTHGDSELRMIGTLSPNSGQQNGSREQIRSRSLLSDKFVMWRFVLRLHVLEMQSRVSFCDTAENVFSFSCGFLCHNKRLHQRQLCEARMMMMMMCV